MIENVSTQLTVLHCFAHCLLPGRAFASLYALLFLEKEAEIGGREYRVYRPYNALFGSHDLRPYMQISTFEMQKFNLLWHSAVKMLQNGDNIFSPLNWEFFS